MWRIEEIGSEVVFNSGVKLNAANFGKGWPRGKTGDKKTGFAFYQLTKKGEFLR